MRCARARTRAALFLLAPRLANRRCCSTALAENLGELTRRAAGERVALPPDVVAYVEQARNPDIFTREFVEVVGRMNQMLNGRSAALARMRDLLARDIAAVLPELEPDVARIVAATSAPHDAKA